MLKYYSSLSYKPKCLEHKPKYLDHKLKGLRILWFFGPWTKMFRLHTKMFITQVINVKAQAKMLKPQVEIPWTIKNLNMKRVI